MQNHLKVLGLFLAAFFLMTCCLFNTPGITDTPGAPVHTPTEEVELPPPPPSPIPAPTSLNAEGPYVLFTGNGGTWITNPDGSFPTKVSDYESRDLRAAVSPGGDRLVFIVENEAGLDLVMVNIPGGEEETITQLISVTTEELFDTAGAKALATSAIRGIGNIAWQPGEGRLLAFIGAMDGTTTDLYLYDTQSGEITQLTNDASQSLQPSWSPDGEYLLVYGASWVPPFGGAILGPNRMDGVWAIRVSDGEVITLPLGNSTYFNFIGWQDETHYLTFDSLDGCDSQNLRSVDVTSGETMPIMENGFYYYIDISPENGALLFSSAAGCPDSLGDGTFLLMPGETSPTRLLDVRTWEIEWLAESNAFFAYPEALFSADGNTRYDPPVYNASFTPAISKNGYQAWIVIENQVGRVEVKVPGGEWLTIMNGFAGQVIWDPVEGTTLLIPMDDGSLYAAAYPDFSSRLMGDLGGSVSELLWVP